MHFVKRPLNWVLTAIALASVAAILLGQENPVFRMQLCAHVACVRVLNSHSSEKLAYDLGIGSAVSLFLYWLVVRIPENAKRRRIRKSFARHFHEFKEDAIATMLMVADGTYTWGFHQELVDQKRFREYFQQKVADDRDRWDEVHNKMTEYALNELLTQLEVLRGEISFTMAAIDIDDEKVLEFMKRLSATIVRMRETTLDYDSMKSFGNFMYEIFGGFNLVSGYQTRDFFEDMISAI